MQAAQCFCLLPEGAVANLVPKLALQWDGDRTSDVLLTIPVRLMMK